MYPQSFQKLIDRFSSLPGIGPKMAERLVLHVFKNGHEYIDAFTEDLMKIKIVSSCKTCFNIAQNEQCTICTDTHRDQQKLCIVEEPLDIIPIERSRAFNGLYHVLGGTIKKQDASFLTVDHLLHRLTTESFTEIIIATNFTTEGDMTAMYLQQRMQKFPVTVSRIARGLATGSDIEYADDMTIRSSLNNREILRTTSDNPS